MNVEIGTEAAQFPEKEYITGIFLAVLLHRFWNQNNFFAFYDFSSFEAKQAENNSYIRKYVF